MFSLLLKTRFPIPSSSLLTLALIATCFAAAQEFLANGRNLPKIRVAFVFAGSPRSFIDPIVHLSIKHNLIDGFCSQHQQQQQQQQQQQISEAYACQPHVFARFSFTDNSHDLVKYSSKGVLLPRSNRDRDNAIAAIKRLADSVTYEEVDIGSQLEQDDMLQLNNSNHPLHRLYRDLDPRRYSMYFNRWSAYQMALREEQSSGVKFDWVVHARLDFFFGEPLRPVSVWSPERVWVIDEWSYDVPDVFALLPRKFSDRYYSMDDLYLNPNAICLGGPDFNQKTISEKAFAARGYTSTMQLLVQQERCHQKFPGNLALDRKTNVEWSIQGTSEVILRRKLASLGIKRFDTLGYSTFFAIMVRHPIMFNCLNTRPNSHIGWLRNVYYPTSAMSHGCYSVQYDLKYLMAHKSASASRYGANCDMDTLSSKEPQSQVDSPQSACLLDGAITEWNFLPYQLEVDDPLSSTNACLTVDNIDNRIGQGWPLVRSCMHIVTENKIRTLYAVSQLFHFYPRSTAPQRITNFQIYADQRNCLTILSTNEVGLMKGPQPKLIGDDLTMVFARCAKSPQVNQLFRTVIVGTTNNTTKGEGLNMRLQWYGMKERYCIAINNEDSSQESRLSLEPCANTTLTVFTAYRTRNVSPTQALSTQLLE